MFLFKAVQARNCSSLIIFEKRSAINHSKRNRNFIAEFSFRFPTNVSDDEAEELIKNNLYIRITEFEIRVPFHIERKYYKGGSFLHVLFEVEKSGCFCHYSLCWNRPSECVLCWFLIDNSHGDSDNKKNLPSLECSIKKVLQIFENPHLIRKSWWITLAKSLSILLHGTIEEKQDLISNLDGYELEMNLENFPSIENWINSIIEIFTKNRINYDREVYKLCNDYSQELTYAKKFSTRYSDDVFNFSGFLAMCRIAFNGNKFARELCVIFLEKAIGKSNDSIISEITSTYYSCHQNISIIILDYLKDFSLLEQNLEIEDFEYYEKVFYNIDKLNSSEIDDMFILPYFSNSYIHYDLENESYYLKEDYTSGKLGSKIPNDIFRAASMQAKRGNKKCIELFEFISNNMEESTEQALIWTVLSLTDLSHLFKVRLYLMDKLNHVISSCWIARKYIIGIPGIIESNTIYGYALLKKLYIDTKSEYAASSLCQLFLENVEGFPKDLEKVLFWLKKSNSNKYNDQFIHDLKTIHGISISHDETYFFDNSYSPKKSFFAWLFNK